MRRVVITGMGIWSCIGQDLLTVTENLKKGQTGIIYDPERIAFGLQCGLVGSVPRPDLRTLLPRRNRVTMNEDTEYAYMAVRQALDQAHITDEYLCANEVGIVFGGDGNTTRLQVYQKMQQEKDTQLLDPYYLYQCSASSCVVNLNTLFHLRGVSAGIGAACASSSHAIGIGKMYIEQGKQDIVIVGGCTEVKSAYFIALTDAIGALSLNNSNPKTASRPFDVSRDGFVPSGGAAALIIEEYEHAIARGATILAELAGYGFSSNGIENISQSSSDAEYIAMKRALENAHIYHEEIDYVNAHATSTIQGDIEEAKAITRLFGSKPYVSSTKSITGHETAMAGASEAVYSILMMQNGFVAPNINLENVIDEAKDLNIVRETIYTPITTVLSNSSGMGGTNSALIFKKI